VGTEPPGYVTAWFDPLQARRFLRRKAAKPGPLALRELEREYRHALKSGLSDEAYAGAVLHGEPDNNWALYALAAASITSQSGYPSEYVEPFSRAALDHAPGCLLAQAYINHPTRGGGRQRLWFTLAEALLLNAARVDMKNGDTGATERARTGERLDAVRPGWREEYRALWVQRQLRAALVYPGQGDQGHWAYGRTALLEPVEALSPENAAQIVAVDIRLARLARLALEGYWEVPAGLAVNAVLDPRAPVVEALVEPGPDGQTQDGQTQAVGTLGELLDEALRNGAAAEVDCAQRWRYRLQSAQLPSPGARLARPGPTV